MVDSRRNMEETSEDKIKRLIGFNKIEQWGLGIGILLVFIAPAILSKLDWGFDFTETGQIGDTIGGITAPIVNLMAAYLVYKSFVAQITANSEQRKDHNEQIQHLSKEHGFNYITSLFNSIKDSYYSDRNSQFGLKSLGYVYQTIEETIDYCQDIDNIPVELRGDMDTKEERKERLNRIISPTLIRIRNHLDNLILLIEEIGKLNLERGMRHFYKFELERIIEDMNVESIIKNENWETIEKSDLLHGYENQAILNTCLAKAIFIVKNKNKMIWPKTDV